MTRILLAIALLFIAAGASAQRTSRPGLRPDAPAAAAQVPEYETSLFVAVSPDSVAVSLAGYDKPLRSRRETFHAVNSDSLTVGALALTFTYLDTSGRMLHRRSCRVATDLPAGQTRLVSVPSWDLQRSFFYIHSAPERAAGTPFDVKIDIDTVFVLPKGQNRVNER